MCRKSSSEDATSGCRKYLTCMGRPESVLGALAQSLSRVFKPGPVAIRAII